MGRSQGDLNSIVKVLAADPIVISRHDELFGELSVSCEAIQLQNLYKIGFVNAYEMFYRVLEIWIQIKDNSVILDELCEHLRRIGLTAAADTLEKEFETSSTILIVQHPEKPKIRRPLWENIGPLAQHFVGRQTELQQLHQRAFPPKPSFIQTSFVVSSFKRYPVCSRRQFLVIITGMGGVGKTELARQFAEQYQKQSNHDCVLLDGDNIQAFLESLSRLAKGLNLKIDEKLNATDRFKYIIGSLSLSSGKILIIIDNVDEANDAVESLVQYFNQLNPSNCPFVIITSRKVNNEAFSFGFRIELDALKNDEAVHFLKMSLVEQNDSPLWGALIKLTV